MKRLFDIFFSSIGLVLSFPLWLLFSLIVKLDDGGPIFYSQERIGKDGKAFKVVKFRSMIPDAEKETGAIWAKENDRRVTRGGRFLRATAMDELPQLLSILKGDMSFVGPRPVRYELAEKFAQKVTNYHSRVSIKPGLTGMAQVYARYDTSPRHKLRYDLLYIKRQSVWLDIKLILLSFRTTFKGEWESRGKRF